MSTKKALISIYIITLFPLLTSAAKLPCTVKALTDNCSLFKQVKPGDYVEFADGSKVAGCFIATADSELINAEERREEEHLAQFALLLDNLPDSIVSSVFIEEMRDDDFKHFNLAIEGHKVWVPWPPNNRVQEERYVDSKVFLDYFKQRLDKKVFEKILQLGKEEFLTPYSLRNKTEGYGKEHLFPDARKRELRLFEYSKRKIREMITQGRPLSQLSREEKSMLIRLETLNISDSDKTESAECGPVYMAGYSHAGHKVGIPPSLFFMPDESLLRVMAHEIAHAVDLCRMVYPLLRLSHYSQLNRERRKWDLENVHYYATGRESRNKYTPKEVFEQEILATNHPFLYLFDCFTKHPTGVFSTPSFKDIEPLSKDGACTHNKQQEAFSDWMAAEVQASWFQEHGPTKEKAKNKKGLFAAQVDKFLHLIGRKTFKIPAGMEYLFFQMDLACAEDKKDSYTHPSWEDRVNYIILKNKGLQKLLNCDPPSGPPKCDIGWKEKNEECPDCLNPNHNNNPQLPIQTEEIQDSMNILRIVPK